MIKKSFLLLLIICTSFLFMVATYGTNQTDSLTMSDNSAKTAKSDFSYKTVDNRISISKVRYWGYQLQDINLPGSVTKLSRSNYDLLVLEPTRTDWSSSDKYYNTRKMVQTLKNTTTSDGKHRKMILAYLDIGEAENWRWYWKWSKIWTKDKPRPSDWPSYILSHDPDGWEGNFPVAYWDTRWKDLIIYGKNQNSKPYGDYNSAIDEAIKDGFDGIYIDWVEGYEDPNVLAAARKQGKNSALEMIKFIKEMRTYAKSRNPNFIIIQQNAAKLCYGHSQLFPLIDAISQEAVWYDGTSYEDWNDTRGYDIVQNSQLSKEYASYLSKYKKAGKPVFNCEYSVKYTSKAYYKSKLMGYIPYFSRRPLSELTPIYSQNIKIKAPNSGVYTGAFPDFGGTEDKVNNLKLLSFIKLTKKNLLWAQFSENWGVSGIKFPEYAVKTIYNAGIIPYIRLMPRSDFESTKEKVYSLQRIINGDFDYKLRKWAQKSRMVGIPIMVDFACEMNGDWFPWSGLFNGGKITNKYGNPYLADGPERYRDAYRHIINLFRREGANQVTFVFHPDAYSAPDKSWNRMSAYYPGDKYIDWIGMSVYGPQTVHEPWESFTDIMKHSYPILSSISHYKPLAVLEFGATEKPPINKKADWINKALNSILTKKYPRIRAISYWHENWINEDGTYSRLRLDSSRSSISTYNYLIKNKFFVSKPVY